MSSAPRDFEEFSELFSEKSVDFFVGIGYNTFRHTVGR